MNMSKDTMQIQWSIMPLERFGVMLFGKLYTEASAYLVINGDDWELRLFDTTHAPEVLDRDWPASAKIALFSNHPEGNLSPSTMDLRNLESIRGASLYIVCEEVCVRV